MRQYQKKKIKADQSLLGLCHVVQYQCKQLQLASNVKQQTILRQRNLTVLLQLIIVSYLFIKKLIISN